MKHLFPCWHVKSSPAGFVPDQQQNRQAFNFFIQLWLESLTARAVNMKLLGRHFNMGDFYNPIFSCNIVQSRGSQTFYNFRPTSDRKEIPRTTFHLPKSTRKQKKNMTYIK